MESATLCENQNLLEPLSGASKITGVIPPLVTPFDRDGRIMENALRKEVGFLIDAGVHGLSLGGSTGEGALLSDTELKAGLKLLREENHSNLPVVCGIIRNSTRDAINSGLIAREAGADALMITPTFYHGTDADGNLSYYREIAAAVGLPIIIYNVIAQNPIGAELMLRLADVEHVTGIKQSVGGLHGLNEMIAACGHRTMVYGAQDDMLFCSYLLGAIGAISAILTAFPELCVEQWNAVQAGDLEKAREIHYRLVPVWQLVGSAKMAFPAMVKAILRILGRDGGYPRRPILDPSPEVLLEIRKALIKARLIES